MSTLDEIQMSARIRIEEPDEIETSGPAAELDTSALYFPSHNEAFKGHHSMLQLKKPCKISYSLSGLG